MKRFKFYISLIALIIFFGCHNDKYKGRYSLYKHYYHENYTGWILLDKHEGTKVEILQFKKGINGRERGYIEAGYYIEDREYSNWNFNTFNTYSFEKNYSSLEQAISAADSNWYLYKQRLENRYSQKGSDLQLKCVDCDPIIIYKNVEMP